MDIDSLLAAESGRIGPDLYQKTLYRGPWMGLTKRETWPDEMGQIISVLTYERSLPTTTVSWTDVGFNSGSGNSCVPSAHQIEFARTSRTYKLQHTALEGPPICVNDLRYSWSRAEQLGKMFNILAQNTTEVWQNRYRDEYVTNAGRKVIARTGLPEDPTSFPLQTPTSPLTQGLLDHFRVALIRDGAGTDMPLAMVNGAPQMVAIMSQEAQHKIFYDNNDLTGIRTDLRESSHVDDLLKPFGVQYSYKNWIHLIDDFPPRYNFTGGAWVRVQPYTSTAATYGNKYIVNSAYETAEYEDTIIFSRDVITCLVPKPITTPGGQTNFSPVNYMGDWKWLNIQDKTDNPDKNWGYFRGVFMCGFKPVHPEWGVVIRHKRSPFSNQLLDES